MSVEVFFSYSHKDEELRDELEIHLSTLKRQRIIEAWHDRQITSGDEFGKQIDQHLESSDIILLLVSPYFLDSDYCHEIEMKRALERHDSGEARVIPIILHPCDWKHSPLSKLLALPKDGKPVSKHPNFHDAFLEITIGIREAIEKLGKGEADPPLGGSLIKNFKKSSLPKVRSSNLRVRKEFSEQERDTFLEETFEFIANYFDGSLNELEKRNSEIKTRFRRIDRNTFTATVYKNGTSISECQISLGAFFKNQQIYYSNDASRGGNSYNEALSVDDDGYMLFLSSGFGFGSTNSKDSSKLTQQGAAEYYWSMLLDPLQ
ncbi:hypothetical protein Pan241w_48910 [Gimesia alba]|uniref:TIR domain-containing protein n=1 Tax=Gimesia alba TaxID=2527973 RepID=A0A517RLM9_9PLAN|nr:toll/interleukin-1 receptor domain-containing protein [Gimesia alba]QDT44775.1 hypothetical protein Pan241w_48910 [Gimesia alba]